MLLGKTDDRVFVGLVYDKATTAHPAVRASDASAKKGPKEPRARLRTRSHLTLPSSLLRAQVFNATNKNRANGEFQVQHYAGWVTYSCADFLEKNKDELPKVRAPPHPPLPVTH